MLFRPLASAFLVGKCLAEDSLMQSQTRNEDALEFVNGKDRVQLSELHKTLYQHHHEYSEAKAQQSDVHKKFHARLTQHKSVVASNMKTATHAEKLKATARQMESEYRRILEMMVAEPQLGSEYVPPQQAIEAVEQTFTFMYTKLSDEQPVSQKMIMDANKVVADCNDAMEGNFNNPQDGVNVTEQLMNTKKTTHKECRIQENALIAASKSQCTIFNNYDKCGANTQIGEFEQNWYVHYKDASVHANQAGTSLQTIVTNAAKCRTDLATEHAKADECDEDQADFEVQFCMYAEKLETTSQQYDQCYTAANNSRNDIVATVETVETDGKLIMKMVKKIQCYLTTLKNVQALNSIPTYNDLQACIGEDPSTTELDINYVPCEPKTDLKDELYKIRHWPGSATGGWAVQYYGEALFNEDEKQKPWNTKTKVAGPGQGPQNPNKLAAITPCGPNVGV